MAVDDLSHLPPQLLARLDAVDEVRSVERADEHLRLRQPQLADDVLANAASGRRRVGMYGSAWEGFLQSPQRPILGPKVVPPFADAMRLVDREE